MLKFILQLLYSHIFVSMKNISILSIFVLFSLTTVAQKSVSPYKWDWVRDGIWTGAAIAGTVGGYSLIINKDDITEKELAEIVANKDDINFMDRWLEGNYSEDAITHSYIPFGVAFAAPALLLFDDKINDDAALVMGLYLESLSTTAALYTITAGLVNRSRPYVYNEGEIVLGKRLKNNGQRSFYSGHVAATASASFLTAKVFNDYHPDSPALPYVWAGAAILPASVGYFRIKAGQHFLTDVLLGYALGAGAGILIPELHKTKNEKIDVYPTSGINDFTGDRYSGMTFRYKF